MSRKKKTSWLKRFLKLIFFLITLVVVLAILAYAFAGQIIQKVLPDIVSPMTQSPASVERVNLSLLSGKINIHQLEIGNPAGFHAENIFELGDITISFDPKSILSDNIVIHKIAISGIGISAELNQKGQTNVGVLNQNIQSYLSQSPSTTTSAQAPKTTIPQKASKSKSSTTTQNKQTIMIQDLSISQSKLNLGLGKQALTITVPNIRRKNITNKKTHQSRSEMIATILSYLSEESVKAIFSSGNELVRDQIKNASALIQEGKGKLKERQNAFKETLKGKTNSLKKDLDQTKASLKGLKDLF